MDKKKLTDNPWLRNLFADTLIAYLRFCYATTRWQREGVEEVEKVWEAGGPVVLMFWHERLHFGHASWPTVNAQPVAVLSSQSKFGDMITRVNDRFGRQSIRGSKAKKSDPAKNKGGAQAFRELLRWLRAGNCAATTPDGPRGPRRVMTEGSLKLSQITGAVMVYLGQSTRGYIQLGTWDRMRLPLPFTRGAMIWKVLPPVPADLEGAALETARASAEAQLNAVTARADDLVGAPH
ncbi:MAG: lysophospholipid acyltransferase family protein [Asticcacaulis sp.]|nr:lysophospholipid acyltransferase family protein [Asticcacaulis sp.]